MGFGSVMRCACWSAFVLKSVNHIELKQLENDEQFVPCYAWGLRVRNFPFKGRENFSHVGEGAIVLGVHVAAKWQGSNGNASDHGQLAVREHYRDVNAWGGWLFGKRMLHLKLLVLLVNASINHMYDDSVYFTTETDIIDMTLRAPLGNG